MEKCMTILANSQNSLAEKYTSVLPMKTRSLCPECLRVIDALIHDVDGIVYMDKSCNEHGHCREIISDDIRFYTQMIERDKSSIRKVTNGLKGKQADCPNGCGFCSEHISTPVMANIDLTNRCNLRCPICFANADSSGMVLEMSLEQVRKLLDNICNVNEVQPACFQFTGGEPTVHPNFIEALREAKSRNFVQVQVATNGIKFSQDDDFAARAADAGLNIAYLQFDGMDDGVYQKIRGRPLLDIKLKAIDNLHKVGIRTILVPTIVKGVNDHQIGAITRFALENPERISTISWQPVSFTGRIDYQQRLAQRFTLTDLARQIQQQTGLLDMYRDWYPFGITDPFSRFLEAVEEKPQSAITCNPGCGAAAYIVGDSQRKEFLPITSFVDVEPLMDKLATAADILKKRKIFRKLSIVHVLKKLNKYYHQDRGPKGWTFDTFVDFMLDFANFRHRFNDNQARHKTIGNTSYRVTMIAAMHFQDAYNYQIDRIKRCTVFYAALDGRMYPFCSYNSGPCHRNSVEKKFAIPLSEYHQSHNANPQ